MSWMLVLCRPYPKREPQSRRSDAHSSLFTKRCVFCRAYHACTQDYLVEQSNSHFYDFKVGPKIFELNVRHGIDNEDQGDTPRLRRREIYHRAHYHECLDYFFQMANAQRRHDELAATNAELKIERTLTMEVLGLIHRDVLRIERHQAQLADEPVVGDFYILEGSKVFCCLSGDLCCITLLLCSSHFRKIVWDLWDVGSVGSSPSARRRHVRLQKMQETLALHEEKHAKSTRLLAVAQERHAAALAAWKAADEKNTATINAHIKITQLMEFTLQMRTEKNEDAVAARDRARI